MFINHKCLHMRSHVLREEPADLLALQRSSPSSTFYPHICSAMTGVPHRPRLPSLSTSCRVQDRCRTLSCRSLRITGPANKGGQDRTFSWRSRRISLRCSASAAVTSAARPFTSSYLNSALLIREHVFCFNNLHENYHTNALGRDLCIVIFFTAFFKNELVPGLLLCKVTLVVLHGAVSP